MVSLAHKQNGLDRHSPEISTLERFVPKNTETKIQFPHPSTQANATRRTAHANRPRLVSENGGWEYPPAKIQLALN